MVYVTVDFTEFLKFGIVDNQEEVVIIVSLLNFSLLLNDAKRNWSHLVWNSYAFTSIVRLFTDRLSAVARISFILEWAAYREFGGYGIL